MKPGVKLIVLFVMFSLKVVQSKRKHVSFICREKRESKPDKTSLLVVKEIAHLETVLGIVAKKNFTDRFLEVLQKSRKKIEELGGGEVMVMRSLTPGQLSSSLDSPSMESLQDLADGLQCKNTVTELNGKVDELQALLTSEQKRRKQAEEEKMEKENELSSLEGRCSDDLEAADAKILSLTETNDRLDSAVKSKNMEYEDLQRLFDMTTDNLNKTIGEDRQVIETLQKELAKERAAEKEAERVHDETMMNLKAKCDNNDNDRLNEISEMQTKLDSDFQQINELQQTVDDLNIALETEKSIRENATRLLTLEKNKCRKTEDDTRKALVNYKSQLEEAQNQLLTCVGEKSQDATSREENLKKQFQEYRKKKDYEMKSIEDEKESLSRKIKDLEEKDQLSLSSLEQELGKCDRIRQNIQKNLDDLIIDYQNLGTKNDQLTKSQKAEQAKIMKLENQMIAFQRDMDRKQKENLEEKKVLERDIRRKSDSIGEMEIKLLQMNNMHGGCQQKLKKLIDAAKILKGRFENVTEQHISAKAEFESVKGNMTRTVEDLKNQLSRLEDRNRLSNETVERRLQETDKEIFACQTKLGNVQTSLKQQSKRVSKLEEDLKNSALENERKTKELTESVDELKANYNDEKNKNNIMQLKLETCQGNTTNVAGQHAKEAQLNETLSKKIESCFSDLKSLNIVLGQEKMVKFQLQSEIQRMKQGAFQLSSMNENLKQQVSDGEKKSDELSRNIKELGDKLGEHQNRYNDLSKSFDELQLRKSSIENTLNNCFRQKSSLERESREKSMEIELTQTKLKSQKNIEESLKKDNADLKYKIKKIMMDMDNVKRETKKMEADMELQLSNLKKSELRSKQTEGNKVQSCMSELARIKDRAERLETREDDLKRTIKDRENRFADIQNTLEKEKRTSSDMQIKANNLNKNLESVQRELRKSNKEFLKLKMEMDSMKNNALLEKESEKCEPTNMDETESLKKKLASTQLEIKKLTSKLNEVETEARASLGSCENKVSDTTYSVEECKKENKFYGIKNEEIQRDKADLIKHILLQNDQLSVTEKRLQTLKKENTMLKSSATASDGIMNELETEKMKYESLSQQFEWQKRESKRMEEELDKTKLLIENLNTVNEDKEKEIKKLSAMMQSKAAQAFDNFDYDLNGLLH